MIWHSRLLRACLRSTLCALTRHEYETHSSASFSAGSIRYPVTVAAIIDVASGCFLRGLAYAKLSRAFPPHARWPSLAASPFLQRWRGSVVKAKSDMSSDMPLSDLLVFFIPCLVLHQWYCILLIFQAIQCLIHSCCAPAMGSWPEPSIRPLPASQPSFCLPASGLARVNTMVCGGTTGSWWPRGFVC